MQTIKYTFLLPSYKALFFEEALQSIKNQTYRDFKVIVSDDCSPEDLKSIYDKVCGDDPRFTFRRNDENMGSKSLVSHWNLLVDICDTEWFIMAGDDDVYERAFLEEMDKLQVKYPNVDLLHARVNLIDKNGDVVRMDALYEEYVGQIAFISQFNYYRHIECIGNHIFRRMSVNKINGFPDFPLAWSADTYATALLSKNGVANSYKILFRFRSSGINISTKNNSVIVKQKRIAERMYLLSMEKLLYSVQTDNSIMMNDELNKLQEINKARMLGYVRKISCLECYDYVRLCVKYGYFNSIKDIIGLFIRCLLFRKK